MSDTTLPSARLATITSGSLMMVAVIFGLTYGLSGPLFMLELTERGYSTQTVAINAMMHALGVLLIAPFLPRIAVQFGPRRPVMLALCFLACVLLAFPFITSASLWFPLRTGMGIATETLLILSESWLNQMTPDTVRTRTMGLYSAMMSAGFALGPLLLGLTDRHSFTPFLITSGLLLLTFGLIAMPWVETPQKHESTQHTALWRYVALAPIAISATLLLAMLEASGSSFLSLYAMQNGWPEKQATLLLSAMLLGAICFQLPLGWLGDRISRRHLLIALGTLSCLGALLWPVGIAHQPWAYVILFIWDGLFAGLYTIVMTVVGSRYQGKDLVAIYAVSSVAWGAGTFIGPEAASTAMGLTSNGLPLFVSIACGLFTLLPVFLKKSA